MARDEVVSRVLSEEDYAAYTSADVRSQMIINNLAEEVLSWRQSHTANARQTLMENRDNG